MAVRDHITEVVLEIIEVLSDFLTPIADHFSHHPSQGATVPINQLIRRTVRFVSHSSLREERRQLLWLVS
jgi:hypothetical protein